MREENINNLLQFLQSLREKEKLGEGFTPQSIAKETKYQPSTIRKYLSSFLRAYCIFNKESKLWYCSAITHLTDYDFLELMSQNKTSISFSDKDKFVLNLFQKSKNAFLAAIQLYNNPNQPSRIEMFTILIANSWELLLKAWIVQNNNINSIYKKNSQETISCRDALKKQYFENNKIRKNIETILEIRDLAVHLTVNELQHDLCRLFQSTILNYNTKFIELTGASPIPSMNSGLLNLVVDGDSPSATLLKHKYGEMSANIIKSFINRLNNQSTELNSPEFAISIDYKLCLTKKDRDSDITFTTGPEGVSAIRVYQPIDPVRSHPYKTYEAIDVINTKIQPKSIKSGTFYKIIKKYKIKSKPDYYYLNESTSRYSESFIEWCIKNINMHSEWLNNIKNSK